MNIVIATRNRGKLQEMNFLFDRFLSHVNDFNLVDLNEFSDIPLIEETGSTFHENAKIKAITVANYTGLMAIGDDSGLMVDALGGAPGIFSARFAREKASDEENNRLLLSKLEDVPKESRTAQFVCNIAVALPKNLLGVFEGICHGIISSEPRGGSGFGYDPLFIRTDSGKSFAELPLDVKNRISHRARAFEKAAVVIERYIKQFNV
jgi:XTP/dITP diphosphohydrolase